MEKIRKIASATLGIVTLFVLLRRDEIEVVKGTDLLAFLSGILSILIGNYLSHGLLSTEIVSGTMVQWVSQLARVTGIIVMSVAAIAIVLQLLS
ncbi:hypothetical protein [Ruegeria sp. HKCCD8929]|uniref:hypothetical protein n=1 Tax=Ruegeria sp. HKCCD8929 TaxID=2683006 RepID=UPI0014882D75|nr:hypothetical protein [Ruegeria sp. HKCCD8929]